MPTAKTRQVGGILVIWGGTFSCSLQVISMHKSEPPSQTWHVSAQKCMKPRFKYVEWLAGVGGELGTEKGVNGGYEVAS